MSHLCILLNKGYQLELEKSAIIWIFLLILLTLWTISLFDWFTVLFWDSKHVIYMDISSFFQISWKKTLISIVFCLCITYIRCIHRFAQSLLPLSAGASCKSWALMSLGPLPKWLAAFAELHQCQYDCIKGSVLYIIPWLWSTRPGYCVNLQVSHSFLMNWRADSDSISQGRTTSDRATWGQVHRERESSRHALSGHPFSMITFDLWYRTVYGYHVAGTFLMCATVQAQSQAWGRSVQTNNSELSWLRFRLST